MLHWYSLFPFAQLGVVKIIENLMSYLSYICLKMNQNRFFVHNRVLEVFRLFALARREEVGLDSGINFQGSSDEKLEEDFFIWFG